MTVYTGSGISQGTGTTLGSAFETITTPQGLNYATRYVGEPGIPKAVARRRRWVYDAFRRLGTPFLFKHRYSADDVDLGIAQPSPAFDTIYGRSGRFDTLSHGVGFVSQELSPNEWYDQNGNIKQFATPPGAGWTQAALYRGYGPGWIVYLIQPDSPLDYLKVDPAGVAVRVEQPQILCPWYPIMNDGDLLISLEMDNGGNVLHFADRYECRQMQPVTVRGYDKKGRRDTGVPRRIPTGDEDGASPGAGHTNSYVPTGNSFVLNQISAENRLPKDHTAYGVETDR
jgi:hypothetical protein